MISALTPPLNLLAPKAAAPVAGDPAAFGLVLAELGEAASGRQVPAPTGKAMPPAGPAPSLPGLPMPTTASESARLPIHVVNVPVGSPTDAPEPAGWPRFARPEPYADPVASAAPPITPGEPEAVSGHALPTPRRTTREGVPAPALPTPDQEVATLLAPKCRMRTRADADGTTAMPPTEAVVANPTSPPLLGSIDDEPAPAVELPSAAAPASLPPPPQAPQAPLVIAPVAPVPMVTSIAPSVAAEPGSTLRLAEIAASPILTPGSRPPTAMGDAAPGLVATRLVGTPATGGAGTPTAVPVGPSALPIAPRPDPAASAPPATIAYTMLTPSTPARTVAVPRERSPMAAAPGPMSIVTTPAPARFAGPPLDAGIPAATLDQAVPPAMASTSAVSVAPIVTAATAAPTAADRSASIPTDRPSSTPGPAERSSDLVAAPAPTAARAVMSGSARQVFAADLRRTARDPRLLSAETLPAPLEGTRLDAAVATAAAPAAPLDLRQERWPSAMVERIERLRDAVDAVDTRIRLIPDALGAIDVAVKRDGDTVHVHFTAEQAATRALLHDAAPRLAEAAEARGLKLGQTAVGGDGAQPNGRQPQSQQNTAPVPARPRPAAALDEDAADTRIA